MMLLQILLISNWSLFIIFTNLLHDGTGTDSIWAIGSNVLTVRKS